MLVFNLILFLKEHIKYEIILCKSYTSQHKLSKYLYLISKNYTPTSKWQIFKIGSKIE